MASETTKIRLRDKREPGHFWADNEILDVFGDELGQNGISVYMTMTRFCYGAEVRLSLREIAAAARMSKDTVSRSMKVLVAVGLVIETKGLRTKTVSTWSLANVKALVQEYVRESARQTVSQSDRLKSLQERESASHGASSTLVQLVKEQRANCLTVRQMDSVEENEACVAAATDLSQMGTGFETDLSQSEGSHLYSKTQDTKLQDTTPVAPRGGVCNFPNCDCLPEAECDDKPGTKPWERSACAAVQLVKRECGWSGKGLDSVIEQALRAECEKLGGTVDLLSRADVMVAGWREYLTRKHLLRYAAGERKFITLGWWFDCNRWPWDEVLLREKRRL